MTLIVAVKDKSGIYMGADSITTKDWDRGVMAQGKLFKVAKNTILIGLAGSPRAMQILKYHVEWDPIPKGLSLEDTIRHFITKEIPKIRTGFETHWFSGAREEKVTGNSFILACGTHLLSIHSDYQVCALNRDYDADGCAYEYALGSLHSTIGMDPTVRVNKALEAGLEHSIGVAKPFVLEKL